jgi:predicted nucleic acid-binding protein
MPELRRIVPDNSVIIEAMLPRIARGLMFRRAQQLLGEILRSSVKCFAPDTLVCEFLKVAFATRAGSRSKVAATDEIERQVESFLKMPIEYIPSKELAAVAINHRRRGAISMPDSWYLAAAEMRSAELWISHRQADGFAKNASKIYDHVFTLADNDFYRVGRKHGG